MFRFYNNIGALQAFSNLSVWVVNSCKNKQNYRSHNLSISPNFLTKLDLFIFQANDRYGLATKIALVAAGFTFLAWLTPAFDLKTAMQMDSRVLWELVWLFKIQQRLDSGPQSEASTQRSSDSNSDWSTSRYKYLSHCVKVSWQPVF